MKLELGGDGVCHPGVAAEDYQVDCFWQRRYPLDPRFFCRRYAFSWTGLEDGSSVEHLELGVGIGILHFRWYLPPASRT